VIYQFFDEQNTLIYVGKSKNIKTRVASYFSKNHENLKTKVLASKVVDIKYVVVKNEMDALLLENNLIKKEKPKYNILLKDGKTYPWLCISKEEFPRIFQTRKVKKDGSEYYGPYMSSQIVKIILDYISDMFYDNGWTPFTYLNKNKDPDTKEKYQQIISSARKIIKGNIKILISYLTKQMNDLSECLEFEKAQKIKDKITLLNNYQSKSVVVSSSLSNIDVFSVNDDEQYAYVNYMKINKGSIDITHTIEIQKKLNENVKEILKKVIVHMREKFKSSSRSILIQMNFSSFIDGVRFHVPVKGEKKTLLDLSLLNAKYMKMEMKKKRLNFKNKKTDSGVLASLKKDLRLDVLPKHIECFDNSNLQGSNPVASCVVFKNGIPAKKDYRNFNIKTVSGIDDFKSMTEVVFRRYARLQNEKKELPQLIVIDGGKGQLSSAKKSLDKLKLKINIIGIAKRLEEIFFPEDPLPLYLEKRSESLRLLQRIRNEAHRFAITHHRKKRIKEGLSSSIDSITGIGPKSIEKLIAYFGTVNKIKLASKNELEKIVGDAKSNKILKYYSNT
jgi:excinuclease ABC subunit C